MEQNYENPDGNKKTLWIVAGIIIVIMIIGVVYGATQQTLKKQSASVNQTGSVPLQNVPATTGSSAVLGATETVETPATVTGLDIVNLQTFPYKVQARIRGNLADGCSTAQATITQSGKTFTITVVGSKAKDAVCTAVVTPYETVLDIPVAGASAGTYTVKVGKITKTFKLAEDNTVQFTSDK